MPRRNAGPSSKKVTLMRAPVSAVLAAAVCLGPAAAGAAADDGTNVPARANPIVWADYAQKFAAANAIRDWNSVSGELVADSGFRPSTMASVSSTPRLLILQRQAVRYRPGRPEEPQCRDHAFHDRQAGLRGKKGYRTLHVDIVGAEWMRAMNGDMSGGHCFGFAATASMLYEGGLQPRQFQPGVNPHTRWP